MKTCEHPRCMKLDGHGGLHGTWDAERQKFVPLKAEHRTTADYYAGIPRQAVTPAPLDGDTLARFALDFIEWYESDEANAAQDIAGAAHNFAHEWATRARENAR